MVVKTSAPCRISLLGGGTDVGDYCRRFGGVTFSMAINIRQEMYVTDESPIMEIPEGGKIDFYLNIMRELGIEKFGIKCTFDGEITGGLGSSAAATVSLLGAGYRLQGREIDRQEIAERAYLIETSMGLFGGKQDQYAATYGGINVVEYPHFGEMPIVTSLDRALVANLLPHMSLFHLGFNRGKGDIQERFRICDTSMMMALDRMKENLVEGMELLAKGDIEAFGNLMNKNWNDKKKTNRVSNGKIDEIYKKALKLGAWGGKVLGAGQGGYLVLFAKHPKHLEKLGLKQVDFEVDYEGLSTRVL